MFLSCFAARYDEITQSGCNRHALEVFVWRHFKLCQDAPQSSIPAWVEEWPKLQQCAWPKLRPLMDVFGRFEVRNDVWWTDSGVLRRDFVSKDSTLLHTPRVVDAIEKLDLLKIHSRL